MTSTEDPGTPGEYRYIVRHIGSRRQSPGQYMPGYGTEVVDLMTGEAVATHWALSARSSSLVAEAECARLNGATTALSFPEKLELFIERVLNSNGNPGDTLEDVGRILAWHMSRIRGLSQEPLDQNLLYNPAPEFDL